MMAWRDGAMIGGAMIIVGAETSTEQVLLAGSRARATLDTNLQTHKRSRHKEIRMTSRISRDIHVVLRRQAQ